MPDGKQWMTENARVPASMRSIVEALAAATRRAPAAGIQMDVSVTFQTTGADCLTQSASSEPRVGRHHTDQRVRQAAASPRRRPSPGPSVYSRVQTSIFGEHEYDRYGIGGGR